MLDKARAMSRFDECLKFILQREGGFVDDPSDRGGATNMGITEATDDAWDKAHGIAEHPVRTISHEEVADIYRSEYWDKCRCNDLPPRFDLLVFDSAVQHGVSRAVKWMQLITGSKTDGQCGEKTLYAVHEFVLDRRVPELTLDVRSIRASSPDIRARGSSPVDGRIGWTRWPQRSGRRDAHVERKAFEGGVCVPHSVSAFRQMGDAP